jgi:hypothetical protein
MIIGFGDMAMSSCLVEQVVFGGCYISGILCTLVMLDMDQFNITISCNEQIFNATT